MNIRHAAIATAAVLSACAATQASAAGDGCPRIRSSSSLVIVIPKDGCGKSVPRDLVLDAPGVTVIRGGIDPTRLADAPPPEQSAAPVRIGSGPVVIIMNGGVDFDGRSHSRHHHRN